MNIKEFTDASLTLMDDTRVIRERVKRNIVDLFNELGISELTLHNEYNSEYGENDPIYITAEGELDEGSFNGVVSKIIINDPDQPFDLVSVYVVDPNEGRGLIYVDTPYLEDWLSITDGIEEELKHLYKEENENGK